MRAKTLIPLWILSYAPPVFLLAMPYFGMHVKPGGRPIQIVAGIVMAIYVTLSNAFLYRRQRNIEKTIAAIRARGVVGSVAGRVVYQANEQEMQKL